MDSEIKSSDPEKIEVVIEGKTVLPGDINSGQHFYGAFNERETEVSANWIVRFLQQDNEWRQFSYEELNEYYKKIRKDPDDNYTFNALIEDKKKTDFAGNVTYIHGGWLRELPEGKYSVTKAFVRKVYESSPIKEEALNRHT